MRHGCLAVAPGHDDPCRSKERDRRDPLHQRCFQKSFGGSGVEQREERPEPNSGEDGEDDACPVRLNLYRHPLMRFGIGDGSQDDPGHGAEHSSETDCSDRFTGQ